MTTQNNMEEINMDSLERWYQENKSILKVEGDKAKETNTILHQQFLKDWPISRLKNMSIDEYVIGKGRENKSLCYQLENGKYASLFMGIGGGSSRKYGIYYSPSKKGYYDQSGTLISDEELPEVFDSLKKDLVSIITKGVNKEFDDPIFDQRNSTNTFINRVAMVTKLLCLYSPDHGFSGVNMKKNQKEIWGKLIPLDKQGGFYKQNHEVTSILKEKNPEFDSYLTSFYLWKYSIHFDLNSDDDNGDEEMEKKNYSKILLASKNIILHGAPGTGKSYLAKKIAAQIVSNGEKNSYSELDDDAKERIGFVQFHPSYDYTDFIEGLRPHNSSDGSMTFELTPGVFSKFIQKARTNSENSKKTSSELDAEDIAQQKITNFLENVKLNTQEFYTITNNRFVISGFEDNHIRIDIPDNKIANGLNFTTDNLLKMLSSNKSFSKVSEVREFFNKTNATQQNSYDLALFNEIQKFNENSVIETSEKDTETEKNFVFIIDEINRGEISKIFGELFFSIDPGYRGIEGSVETQYANLHSEQDKQFYIPDNVYIIGTMNDIDRSVDTFDFAMRRRFRFVNVMASDRVGMLSKLGDKREEAERRLRALNEQILQINELNENYQIGPAYFLKLEDVSYSELWDDYLEPLLHDYVRGLYNEDALLQELKAAYEGDSTAEVTKDTSADQADNGDDNETAQD